MMRRIFGNFKLAFFLAFKSIWKGNRWAVLLIIGVMALSFAQLMLTPSIISGVTKALNSQQIDTLYANALIDPNSGEYYLENADRIQALLTQQPGVAGAAVHLTGGAFLESNWETTGSTEKSNGGNYRVIGINPDQEKTVTTISQTLISGSYLSPGDDASVLLGIEIAGGTEASGASFLNLGGAKTGDRVRLTFSNGVQRVYTVKGIFKAREGEADRQAFVTYKEMTSVLGTGFDGKASQILVKFQPSAKESEIVSGLKNLGINGEVRSWEEYGGGMGEVVSSFDVIASLISGIGLVVAAIVMFIIIYISAINKKRQIGVLRAIGVNRSAIYISYLCQALFYAVVGIVLGGLLFGFVIHPYFASHPLDLSIGRVSLAIDPATVRNSVIGILVAAVFAGIIPVINVTRQSIIKAIWGS